MQQLSLLPGQTTSRSPVRHRFSHDGVYAERARQGLEERYTPFFEETEQFNRQLVSFQANKTEALHNWMKYREGFSASLVEMLLHEAAVGPGDTILEPFAGSATTLLAAKMLGINGVGVELLPHCHLAWEAKSRVFAYDLTELGEIKRLIAESTPPPIPDPFPHLTITESAFPPAVEAEIMAYARWFEGLPLSEDAHILCRLLLMSVLEDMSYTRKDGQYLRWDGRAEKIRQANQRRIEQDKRPIQGIDKGPLPELRGLLGQKLTRIIQDVVTLQGDPAPPSQQRLIPGNSLYVLPTLPANEFAGVITSPPYANRYDYTRTYALELAFLGVDEGIFHLRQELLSCTVENRTKESDLERFYRERGEHDRFQRIWRIAQQSPVLAEVNGALQIRHERGDVNNRGILRMIDQYFTELTFVFAELHRVCRPGARVIFVNDNVRYAGEVIPVDTLSTHLAEAVGFVPHKIYVLPQRKGNSSQQMGKFGREALRKSITVWEKP
jgi:site-specific DNA-methyltransferase (cytosine-N4-specific)